MAPAGYPSPYAGRAFPRAVQPLGIKAPLDCFQSTVEESSHDDTSDLGDAAHQLDETINSLPLWLSRDDGGMDVDSSVSEDDAKKAIKWACATTGALHTRWKRYQEMLKKNDGEIHKAFNDMQTMEGTKQLRIDHLKMKIVEDEKADRNGWLRRMWGPDYVNKVQRGAGSDDEDDDDFEPNVVKNNSKKGRRDSPYSTFVVHDSAMLAAATADLLKSSAKAMRTTPKAVQAVQFLAEDIELYATNKEEKKHQDAKELETAMKGSLRLLVALNLATLHVARYQRLADIVSKATRDMNTFSQDVAIFRNRMVAAQKEQNALEARWRAHGRDILELTLLLVAEKRNELHPRPTQTSMHTDAPDASGAGGSNSDVPAASTGRRTRSTITPPPQPPNKQAKQGNTPVPKGATPATMPARVLRSGDITFRTNPVSRQDMMTDLETEWEQILQVSNNPTTHSVCFGNQDLRQECNTLKRYVDAPDGKTTTIFEQMAKRNPNASYFAELSHLVKQEEGESLLKDSVYDFDLPDNVYDTKERSTILRRVYYFFVDYRYTKCHPWYQSTFFHDEIDDWFARRVNALYHYQVQVVKHMSDQNNFHLYAKDYTSASEYPSFESNMIVEYEYGGRLTRGAQKLVNRFFDSSTGKYRYAMEFSSVWNNDKTVVDFWMQKTVTVKYAKLTKQANVAAFVVEHGSGTDVLEFNKLLNRATVPPEDHGATSGTHALLLHRRSTDLADAVPTEGRPSKYTYQLPRFGPRPQNGIDGQELKYTETDLERRLRHAVYESELRGLEQAQARFKSEVNRIDREIREMQENGTLGSNEPRMVRSAHPEELSPAQQTINLLIETRSSLLRLFNELTDWLLKNRVIRRGASTPESSGAVQKETTATHGMDTVAEATRNRVLDAIGSANPKEHTPDTFKEQYTTLVEMMNVEELWKWLEKASTEDSTGQCVNILRMLAHALGPIDVRKIPMHETRSGSLPEADSATRGQPPLPPADVRWLPQLVKKTREALEDLKGTSGANELKQYVCERLRTHRYGLTDPTQSLSIILTGPSGVGKTFWAEKYMSVMAASKIVWFPMETYQKKGGGDFIAGYTGQTIPKVRTMIASTFEQGVMIDEMYLMGQGDFAAEAVGQFTADMDAYKGINIFVGTGYKYEIEKLASLNQGFQRRFDRVFELKAYGADELYTVFMSKLKGLCKSAEGAIKAFNIDILKDDDAEGTPPVSADAAKEWAKAENKMARKIFDYVVQHAFGIIATAYGKQQKELTEMILVHARMRYGQQIGKLSDEDLLAQLETSLEEVQQRYEPTLPLIAAKMGASMEQLARFVFASLQESADTKPTLRVDSFLQGLIKFGYARDGLIKRYCENMYDPKSASLRTLMCYIGSTQVETFGGSSIAGAPPNLLSALQETVGLSETAMEEKVRTLKTAYDEYERKLLLQQAMQEKANKAEGANADGSAGNKESPPPAVDPLRINFDKRLAEKADEAIKHDVVAYDFRVFIAYLNLLRLTLEATADPYKNNDGFSKVDRENASVTVFNDLLMNLNEGAINTLQNETKYKFAYALLVVLKQCNHDLNRDMLETTILTDTSAIISIGEMKMRDCSMKVSVPQPKPVWVTMFAPPKVTEVVPGGGASDMEVDGRGGGGVRGGRGGRGLPSDYES